MSQLITTIEEGMSQGLFKSLPGRKGALWKDGRNITFLEESVQAGLGQFGMFYTDTAETITGVKATNRSGERELYFGTPTKLKKWNGTSIIDLTNTGGDYTGTVNSLWQFARWGSWMVATNGVDKVQVDKNDGNGFVDLAGVPFTWAKLIAATDTQLIAANTNISENWLGFTDADDIEEWVAASDTFAGSRRLRNIDSEITALKKRGSGFAIFTLNEMYGMDYVGPPNIFRTRELLTGFGAVGKHAVTTIGRRHFGFGRRGLWVTDGTSFEFIDSPRVNDFVFGDSGFQVNQDYIDRTIAWHDQLQQSVVFYYPSKGFDHNNIGISYNYKTGAFTIYDYGRTIVDDSGVYPFAVAGDRVGNIYQQSATAVAPQAGEQGFLDIASEEYEVELGYGDGGYGELGYGGVEEYDDNDGIDVLATANVTIIDSNNTQYASVVFSSGDLYVVTKDLDFGYNREQKYIDTVFFDIEAPDDVQLLKVQIGYRDQLKEDITWLDPQLLGLDNPEINIRTTARYWTFKFTDELPLVQWKISRWDVYGRVMKGRL